MVAPISKRRRDLKTSFRRLKEYLTRQLDTATGEQVLRGEPLLSENLLSLETADAEMLAVARSNTAWNLTDPVLHYQLCWQPGETPTAEHWQEAALETITALGYEEHQYICVPHDDKRHFHVHVMLNRVHPETYRARYAFRSKLALDYTIRQIEHNQGWRESPGLYRWDADANVPVANTRAEMAQIAQEFAERNGGVKPSERPRGPAAKMEHYNDRESLESYAKREPAKSLRTLIQSGRATWRAVHSLLAEHGLRIERGDKGGYAVRALNGSLRVKASDVFRADFAGKANRERTESELGVWEPYHRSESQVVPQQTYEPQPKRDTEERAKRRDERAAERATLKADYQGYREKARDVLRELASQGKQRRDQIAGTLKTQKRDIRAQDLPWLVKRAMLSHVVAESVAHRRLLAVSLAKARIERGPKTYQQWVIDLADSGDKRAIAQLRGWQYQDHRNFLKAQEELQKAPESASLLPGTADMKEFWNQMVNARLKELQRQESLAQTIAATRWDFDRDTGDVRYKVAGKLALIDRGRSIRVVQTDEAATVLALEMAVAKYGSTINAAGPAEWKRYVAEVAAKNGITLKFTDPTMERIRSSRVMASAAHRDQAALLNGLLIRFRRNTATLHLVNRAEAEAFINMMFGPAGSDYLAQLERGTAPGKGREQSLLGIADFTISRSEDGSLGYSVRPSASRSDAVQVIDQALQLSATRAREDAERPQRPHTQSERSRDRGRHDLER